MALQEQAKGLAAFVRRNKELISVSGAVVLGMLGVGATYAFIKADRKLLEVQMEKERELRQKGEESLTTIVAANAEKERELRQKVEESLKTTFEADRKVLVANAEKERELRQKGEEGMQSKIDAAKAEAAKEMMEKIFNLSFHEDFERFRSEKNVKLSE